MPAINAVGEQLWGASDDYLLLSIPLYILLGEILVRGGATDKMYRSLSDWLNRLPGGLLHTNIGASALFSAVSGSSVATAATISTVALPSFRNRKYDQRLVLGSIAAGASLGNLIPPGVAFIIYGSMTNTSASRLYMAGLLPGRHHDGAVPADDPGHLRLEAAVAGSREAALAAAREARATRCTWPARS